MKKPAVAWSALFVLALLVQTLALKSFDDTQQTPPSSPAKPEDDEGKIGRAHV